jgi:purine nucleosidase
MPNKVILDVDTGIDDALALLLAANSPELEILGVTCVAGNVTLDHVTRNTLSVLELAGCDVPVAVGARKPLMASLRTATYFHGSNGIAGIELPAPKRTPVAEDAASFLVRTVRQYPGEVTVVPVGPLTNIALAVLRDPDFASNVASLVIMGGAIAYPGNVTASAEANFSNDPEAAEAVVTSGAPLKLVDLAATSSTVLPFEWVEAAGDRELPPAAAFARRLLEFYGAAYVSQGARGPVLHDPLAVALALDPSLATFVPLWLRVETAGEFSRGMSVGNFNGMASVVTPVGNHRDVVGLEPVPFNATVARDVDVPRFLQLFMERVGLA